MNREEVYDTLINPLMSQIIAICKEHKIPLLADFAIGHEGDEGLKCTTALLADDMKPPAEMVRAFELLKPKSGGVMMITTEHGDGHKTIEAIL